MVRDMELPWDIMGLDKCVTWEVNSGPLSDWKEVGIPNVGMMWVTIIDATVEALLLEVGKASTHPEKVSTRTKR
jgi:hypothetical protein